MLEDGSRESKKAYSKNNSTRFTEGNNCCLETKKTFEDSKVLCCKCIHKRQVSPLTCLAICVLVLIYNLLGGFIFLAIEGNTVTEETSVAASKPNLSQVQDGNLRSKTVEKLWSITEDLNILYKENWTKLAAKELIDFEKVLMKSIKGVATLERTHPQNSDHRWTFSSSFLYALTLITTIGHGNVTPRSSVGRMVAVAYACVGIPIIMLYLSTVGEVLARNFRIFYSKLCPSRQSGDFHLKSDCHSRYSMPAVECKQFMDMPRKEHIFEKRQKRTPFQAALNLESLSGGYHWTCRDHTRVPIFLSLLLIGSYITLGTFVFQKTEKWTFIDGCFFSFASLATIGFGDLKPGQYASSISAKTEDIAIGVCCIYILLGIVITAMCFNLIHEDISTALKNFRALCAGASKTRVAHSSDGICEDKIAMSIVS